MTRRPVRTILATGAIAALALGIAGTASSAATTDSSLKKAHLTALNNSGTTGTASVRSTGLGLNAMVHVTGAAANLPHAQHIHFGKQAAHECPTARHAGSDFRLNTADGVPQYGPIAFSLTTKGNTADVSGLAVDRMPVASPSGRISYYRTNMRVVASKTDSANAIAAAIRAGQGVVVVHGVDYNGNGKYDFASAGKSELNPALPAEATDPAACGVLR